MSFTKLAATSIALFSLGACQVFTGLWDLDAVRVQDAETAVTSRPSVADAAAPDREEPASALKSNGDSGVPDAAACAVRDGDVCNPTQQCGCRDEVEHCVFDPIDSKPVCVTPGDSLALGKCDQIDDCPRGYQCAANVCQPICDAALGDNACPSGTRCIQLTNAGKRISGSYICTSDCNPEQPEDADGFAACGAGLSCVFRSRQSPEEGRLCALPARATQRRGYCTSDDECEAGLLCSQSQTCERWCEVRRQDEEAVCVDTTETCTKFSTSVIIDRGDTALELAMCCVPPVQGGPCDTYPQCGCADSEKCDFDDNHLLSCMAAGETKAFAWCENTADCQAGAHCFNNVCRPLCDSTRPNSCATVSSDSLCVGTGIDGLEICTPVCNLERPVATRSLIACPAGTTCILSRSSQSVWTTCWPLDRDAGTKDHACDDGSGQADSSKCLPGYYCDQALLTCQPYCTEDSACESSATCRPFNESLVVGNIPFGHCE